MTRIYFPPFLAVFAFFAMMWGMGSGRINVAVACGVIFIFALYRVACIADGMGRATER